MQILHVITDTNRRGAQVFASDLDAAMKARGVRSRVVALEARDPGGVDAEVLGPSRLSITTLRTLRKVMAEVDVTIAHGSSTLPACRIASLGARYPFVTRQISETAFWAHNWSRRLRVRWYLSGAARTVALALSSADELCEILNAVPERIRVVPNGVPAAGFAPPTEGLRSSARAQWGLDVAAPTLLVIGALAPEKGVDHAIRTLGSAAEAQLLVVGQGPERAKLEELAQRVAPGRVHFVGSITDPQRAYAAADLLLLPSRGGDSMPAVLIEAGFCGLASISTTVGGIPDTIEHGVSGLIVPINDQEALNAAVVDLLDDDDKRRAMGEAARMRCLENFEIGPVAEAWISVLEEIA